jgi:hemoglobin
MNVSVSEPRRRGATASLPTLVAAALLAGLAACAAPPASSDSAPITTPTTLPTLYDRLGGAATVELVVGRLLDRTSTDPRTKRSFDGIKIKAIKESLAQQICAVSGGGCRYEGETMARAHADSKIAASEFDAMVGFLREELDRAGVDAGAKNDLLRLLAPMKRDVVTGAGAPTPAQSSPALPGPPAAAAPRS